jgi:hypothetical protein
LHQKLFRPSKTTVNKSSVDALNPSRRKRELDAAIRVHWDALWRVFGYATLREGCANSQQNIVGDRLCRSFVAIHRPSFAEGGGCNHLNVEVAGEPFEPKH